MSRKALLYFLLIAILALGVWLSLKNKPPSSTLNTAETNFAIANPENITKIEVIDDDGRKLVLEKAQNEQVERWTVNKYYTARQDLVDGLKSTFKNIVVLRPTSKSARPLIMKRAQNPPKTIHVYLKGQAQPKTYLLLAAGRENEGTYAMLKGAENPYLISVRAFHGVLFNRFGILQANWRDRTIFNAPIEQIQSISLQYTEPSLANESFTIRQQDGQAPKIYPYNSTKNGITTPQLTEYLSHFNQMYVESFENTHPRIDSIKMQQAFAIVTLNQTNGKSTTVHVHRMPTNRRTKLKIDKDGNPILYDPDRYFAFINNQRDLTIIQHYTFGPIFNTYTQLSEPPKKQ